MKTNSSGDRGGANHQLVTADPITLEAIEALAVNQRVVERFTKDRDIVVVRNAGARPGTSWLRVYVRDTETPGVRMPTVAKRDSKTAVSAMRAVTEFRRTIATERSNIRR